MNTVNHKIYHRNKKNLEIRLERKGYLIRRRREIFCVVLMRAVFVRYRKQLTKAGFVFG